ncbi:RimK/LysX family protein, partial [Actinoplanes sp. DH11]|uniref:putative ATP-dependent zinc protease n=1 Tax=Actinoplanes sp. DH11 TaxID=2857011 RepID=UPI001E396DDB
AERIELPQLLLTRVPAKIDTGADASSIWANGSVDGRGRLDVVFFGPDSLLYDGKIHTFPKSAYSITRVSSSFGHREIRYKLKLKIKVNGRIINGSFTLADRSTKLYPILLGRSLLRNKFIVDVSKGRPLLTEEKARRQKLQNELLNSGEQK